MAKYWKALLMMILAAAVVPEAALAAHHIVILNEASQFDPAELKALRELGQVSTYDSTVTTDQAIQRLQGADIAVMSPVGTPPEVLATSSRMAGLKLLVLPTTGCDNVDIKGAAAAGILVANTPDYSTQAVAEHTFALLLSMAHHLRVVTMAPNGNPRGNVPLGFDLAGRTLGVMGYGRIGSRVAAIGQGFGMRVVAWDRNVIDSPQVTQVDLDTLLKESDVVTLHLPLNSGTANIIDAAKLAQMKSSAVLINTARGGLVDEKALYAALESHSIRAAGIDALADQSTKNPLLTLGNVLATWHTAYFTEESLRQRSRFISATIRAYVAGSPINVVAPPK